MLHLKNVYVNNIILHPWSIQLLFLSQYDCKPYTKQKMHKDYPHFLSLPIIQEMLKEKKETWRTVRVAPIKLLLTLSSDLIK